MIYKGRTQHKGLSWVQFICPEHDYKGVQEIEHTALKRWAANKRCLCTRVHRDTEDIRRMPTLDQDVEITGEYIASCIKIGCRCRKCGNQWYATPNKLQQGEGCPVCRIEKTKEKNRCPPNIYKAKLEQRVPTLSYIDGYSNVKSIVTVQCQVCNNTFTGQADRILYGGKNCPFCHKSSGERAIALWLKNNKVNYQIEYSFDDCCSNTGKALRFDFYLPEEQTCIEYQGEQHYFPVDFTGHLSPQEKEQRFLELQQRDKIKREFCKSKGITLIEIPYKDKPFIGHILSKYIH